MLTLNLAASQHNSENSFRYCIECIEQRCVIFVCTYQKYTLNNISDVTDTVTSLRMHVVVLCCVVLCWACVYGFPSLPSNYYSGFHVCAKGDTPLHTHYSSTIVDSFRHTHAHTYNTNTYTHAHTHEQRAVQRVKEQHTNSLSVSSFTHFSIWFRSYTVATIKLNSVYFGIKNISFFLSLYLSPHHSFIHCSFRFGLVLKFFSK